MVGFIRRWSHATTADHRRQNPASLSPPPLFLRGEIAEERSKRQSSERQLQLKISKQTNEITIFKAKLGGLEEELKQTKQLSTTKLEEVFFNFLMIYFT